MIANQIVISINHHINSLKVEVEKGERKQLEFLSVEYVAGAHVPLLTLSSTCEHNNN